MAETTRHLHWATRGMNDCWPCVKEEPACTFGDRSFAAAGPHAWNELPFSLRDTGLLLTTFNAHLKTYLFSTVFEATVHLWHLWFLCAAYKCTYLLTYLLVNELLRMLACDTELACCHVFVPVMHSMWSVTPDIDDRLCQVFIDVVVYFDDPWTVWLICRDAVVCRSQTQLQCASCHV